jgi:very-short-patch-repair endonuclease
MEVTKVCPECGEQFTAIGYKQAENTYCSRSCASRAKITPEHRCAFSERARQRMNDPAVRASYSQRMKQDNPMSNPDVKAKMVNSLKGRTFSGERGGNGYITPQQEKLAKALGDTWLMEYPIPTSNPRWRAAVVDIANPERKVAIECDGASHRTKRQRERDRRKRLMLARMGWTLLRFWNSEIDQDLPGVLAAIAESCR